MSKVIDFYPLILESFSKGETFSFPINGISMRPLLKKGDVVMIEKFNEAHVGDIVLYRRDNGQFILHRIRKIHQNYFDIVGDHQKVVEKNVSKEKMIGKVIKYKKGNTSEYKSLDRLSYKIYKFFVRFSIIRFINSHLFK